MKTITCTYHCASCGRHFHSLEAYDAHHAHDRTGWPHCLDPLDLADRDGRNRLVPLTENGVCRIVAGPPQYGVTIWTTPRGVSGRAAAAFKKAAKSLAQTHRQPPTLVPVSDSHPPLVTVPGAQATGVR